METGKIEFFANSLPNAEAADELMEKLIAVGHTDSVFSEPVESGDFKVITAASVSVAMGFGYGGGSGSSAPGDDDPEDDDAAAAGSGMAFGGGGGGASSSRPVAAIEISPDGVRVEPIVDITQIGLALFSTLISIFMIVGKARRRS